MSKKDATPPVTTQRFIKGTEGQDDYLVVAETDLLTVGIKPVVEWAKHPTNGQQGVLIGARVRVIATQNNVIHVGNLAVTTFEGFQFAPTKITQERASAFFGSLNPMPPEDATADSLVDLMESQAFFSTMVATLSPILEKSTAVQSQLEIEAFLKDTFRTQLSAFVTTKKVEAKVNAKVLEFKKGAPKKKPPVEK